MVEVWAFNKITDELQFLDYCNTVQDAQKVIEMNDFVNPSNWEFEIRPIEDNEEPCNVDDECGFDPFVGDYTYDV